MNVEGIENITIRDLKEIFFAVDGLPLKEGILILVKFRDKHGLDDKEALQAFNVANRIFGT